MGGAHRCCETRTLRVVEPGCTAIPPTWAQGRHAPHTIAAAGARQGGIAHVAGPAYCVLPRGRHLPTGKGTCNPPETANKKTQGLPVVVVAVVVAVVVVVGAAREKEGGGWTMRGGRWSPHTLGSSHQGRRCDPRCLQAQSLLQCNGGRLPQRGVPMLTRTKGAPLPCGQYTATLPQGNCVDDVLLLGQ